MIQISELKRQIGEAFEETVFALIDSRKVDEKQVTQALEAFTRRDLLSVPATKALKDRIKKRFDDLDQT